MGIKDNFQQALRELTGTEKDDQQKREKNVDAMKSAVSTDTGEFDAVDPDRTSYEEIQRRASAAASEYDNQQTAFGAGDYDDPNIAPPPQSVTLGSTNFDPTDDDMLSMNRSSGSIPFVEPLQPGVSAVPPRREQDQSTYRRQNANYSQQSANTQQAGYGQQNQGYRRPAQPAGSAAQDQQTKFSSQPYQRPMNDDDEITVISRNTVIDGNIRSFANMTVDGNVKGNIETTKDMDINGKVVGDISCNNAQLRTSQVQGNIRMKGNAYMERDTLLIGDLTSTYANINGKVKGNVSTTGKTELKSDAVIFGDISASTITVNDGAIIQGYVSTTFLNKEESRNIFPDAITIGE